MAIVNTCMQHRHIFLKPMEPISVCVCVSVAFDGENFACKLSELATLAPDLKIAIFHIFVERE